MNTNRPETDEGLVRGIGTWALGANIMNMVIGAGIFALPGLVAALLGPAAILAYLACALIVGLVFLCYAEAGSRITRSGGSYAYIEEAFGPLAGSVASTMLWLGWSVLSDAALAVVMTDVISKALPILREPLPRSAFLVALFAFLAYMNIRGLKAGIRMVVFNTIAKLVPLLLLAIAGLFFLNPDFLVIFEWPTAADFGTAALLLFFAFGGAETALNSSGEVSNPSRTIPRGLFLGISGIFIVYAALQIVAQGTLGPELAKNTQTPLAAAATVVFGNWGTQLLLIGMVVSIFGCLSGDMLNTPRVVFASARDGVLPVVFAKVHPRHHTPHVAIIFYAAAGCGFALSGTFEQLAVAATGSILMIYLGVILAVIRLRQRLGPPVDGQFRLPGGITVPLLSAGIVVWLLLQMTWEQTIMLAAMLALCVVIYLARPLYRKSPAEPA